MADKDEYEYLSKHLTKPQLDKWMKKFGSLKVDVEDFSELTDTPQIRGMVFKMKHLLKVEEI